MHLVPWLRVGTLLLAPFLAAQGTALWQAVPNSNMPPRMFHAAVYDPVRNQVMAHGGSSYPTGPQIFETRYFDGAQWNLVPVGSTPPADWFALAWDSVRNRALLAVYYFPSYQTWSWNGSGWSQVNAPIAAPVQGTVRMVYDSLRDRMVMVVADASQSSSTIQTWEFNGTSWVLRSTGGPPRRSDFAMAYDPIRGRTLLFGGLPNSGSEINDTWEWDGTSWIQYFPSLSPGGRRYAAIAFDPSRQSIVMFGGKAGGGLGGALQDVWEWNGIQWRNAIPRGNLPSIRYGAAMVYDVAAGHLVMCGGNDGSNATALADTFFLTLTTPSVGTWTPFGQGCAGSVGAPVLENVNNDQPYVGETFSLRISNLPIVAFHWPIAVVGFSNTVWNSSPLPLSLAPMGMPGCFAYVDAVLTQPLASSGGVAPLDINLPLDPRMQGFRFYAQGLLFEPGVNAFGAVTSNAGQAIIGVH